MLSTYESTITRKHFTLAIGELAMDDKIGKVLKKTILALILEAEPLILALIGISATFALNKKKFVLTIN